jgi:beta-galactosidase
MNGGLAAAVGLFALKSRSAMKIPPLIFIAAQAVLVASAALAVQPRSDVLLDADWRFLRADVPDASQTVFDDSNWKTVSLPHTWNARDGQDGSDYYRGPAWYRRTLEIPGKAAGRRAFLRFEGAGTVTNVYVNGRFVGEHLGGFGASCCEITPFVEFGASNVIAVRVSNAWRPDLAPLSGDFTVFGGLYRPVHLLITGDLCLSPLDHAAPGVTVLPADISEGSADVTIQALVSHGADAPGEATLVSTIFDAAGRAVAGATETVSVPTGITAQQIQHLTVPHPHLWNGRADPYLYKIAVELRRGEIVIDRVEQPLGLRTIRVDKAGFYLNGKPCRLRGVDCHQDRFDKGWAITEADQKQDIDLILEMGANAVRAAHYQHSEAFYRLCDESGLLVWAELPQVNYVGGPAFVENSRTQLVDLIRQNVNHPCIFAWSLSNELRPPSPDPDPVLLDLNKLAHAEDPTRPTIEATYINSWPSVNMITDLLGINLYPGWYAGDVDAMGAQLDERASWGRGQGFCVSEYGAGASIYQHEAHPSQPKAVSHWHPEEWQSIVHERDWAAIRARPSVWGSFVWNMFDFASARRREGDTPARNDKGLVTYDRKIRKDAFYFYKANWSDEPFVYVSDRRFTPRAVATTDVKLYSNCDRVELAVNDVSQGVRTGDDEHRFLWAGVVLRPGANRIEATADRDGRRCSDECVWTVSVEPPPK